MPKQDSPSVAEQLCHFIDGSPTPFHATQSLASLFTAAGYVELDEGTRWSLEPQGKYYIRRNNSSFIAFNNPSNASAGINMVGAHTDSPCLRIKPIPDIKVHGYWQLGVEVYGGVLLHTWFDRDLSIAGRVSGTLKSGEAFDELIDFKSPIARVPSLAIHLDRTANEASTVNAQKHLPVVIGQIDDEASFKALLVEQCSGDVDSVLDYELSCYDTQSSGITGLNDEFISAARLDNLLSTFIGAKALLDSDQKQCRLFVATDHEEIGSASSSGAQGPFLKSVLERLTSDAQDLTQMISRSRMISCDNAHALHPNYADKHDQNHGPKINNGPVIKINNNQRYATNSVSSARFQRLCKKADVPFQQFVVRSDMGCGSTIGPIMSAELGIETIDIGAPQWAMHSIRETAGAKDCDYLHRVLVEFFNSTD